MDERGQFHCWESTVQIQQGGARREVATGDEVRGVAGEILEESGQGILMKQMRRER